MKSARLVATSLLVSASTTGLLVALDASAAAAATASGCRANVSSFDADGERIDRLTLPGPGGTPGDPFRVDPSGSVRWRVTTDRGGGRGTWAVTTPGLVDLGFDGDGGAAASDRGTEALSRHLTHKLPGLGRVRFTSGVTRVVVVTRDERGRDQCTFGAFVKIQGTPVRTPLFWVGVLAGLVGGALVVAATPGRVRGVTRTHPLLGLLGGALVGGAVTVMLIAFGVVAYGTAMPLVVLGAIAGAGALWGCFGAAPRLAESPPARSDSGDHVAERLAVATPVVDTPVVDTPVVDTAVDAPVATAETPAMESVPAAPVDRPAPPPLHWRADRDGESG